MALTLQNHWGNSMQKVSGIFQNDNLWIVAAQTTLDFQDVETYLQKQGLTYRRLDWFEIMQEDTQGENYPDDVLCVKNPSLSIRDDMLIEVLVHHRQAVERQREMRERDKQSSSRSQKTIREQLLESGWNPLNDRHDPRSPVEKLAGLRGDSRKSENLDKKDTGTTTSDSWGGHRQGSQSVTTLERRVQTDNDLQMSMTRYRGFSGQPKTLQEILGDIQNRIDDYYPQTNTLEYPSDGTWLYNRSYDEELSMPTFLIVDRVWWNHQHVVSSPRVWESPDWQNIRPGVWEYRGERGKNLSKDQYWATAEIELLSQGLVWAPEIYEQPSTLGKKELDLLKEQLFEHNVPRELTDFLYQDMPEWKAFIVCQGIEQWIQQQQEKVEPGDYWFEVHPQLTRGNTMGETGEVVIRVIPRPESEVGMRAWASMVEGSQLISISQQYWLHRGCYDPDNTRQMLKDYGFINHSDALTIPDNTQRLEQARVSLRQEMDSKESTTREMNK